MGAQRNVSIFGAHREGERRERQCVTVGGRGSDQRRGTGVLGGVSPCQTSRAPDRAHLGLGLDLDLVLELNLAVAVRARARRAWVGHAVKDTTQRSLSSPNSLF